MSVFRGGVIYSNIAINVASLQLSVPSEPRMARVTSRTRVFAVRIGGLLLVWVAVWFWPLGKRHISPSYDCARATLPTQVAICNDPQLATRDLDAAEYFQDNLQAAIGFGDKDAAARLLASKATFLTARDRCGSTKWCIARAYSNWDTEVQAIGGAPHRITFGAAALPRPTGDVGSYLLGLFK